MSNMCVTTLDKKPRPSLPREFFARLYESEPQRPVEEVDEDEEVDVTSDSGDGKDERGAPPATPTQLQSLEPRSGVGPEESAGLVTSPLLPAGTVAPPHWRFLQLAHLHGISAYTASVQHLQGQAAYLARRKKKEGRPRRQRTIFSSEQTLRLEDEYRRNAYITRSRRSELADCLNLTETQIKIWFQNHRAKHKRLEKTEQDQYARDLAVAESLMRGVQPLGVLCRFCRMSFYLCICLRTPTVMGSRTLLPPPASTTTSPVPVSTNSAATRNPESDGSPSATVMPL